MPATTTNKRIYDVLVIDFNLLRPRKGPMSRLLQSWQVSWHLWPFRKAARRYLLIAGKKGNMEMIRTKTTPFLNYMILLALSLVAPPVFAESSSSQISIVGTYTNMRHTEEHSYGYTVELWKQGNRVFGFILASNGLSGDTPTGILEDVKFEPESGKLSFRAKLTTGSIYNNQANKWIPSQDIFKFSGTLNKDSLAGVLEISDALLSDKSPIGKEIELLFSVAETRQLQTFSSYEDWEKMAKDILKFRGPKW